MLVDQGLELLTENQAWDLLTGQDVGRVGLSLGALPVILPVNFAVIDGCIVFRTAPGSKLSAAATGAVVAFEVDSYDAGARSGWSVLVVGRSEVVHDLDVTFEALAAKLEPFADGIRSSFVRIRPEFVSGRRLVHDEHPTAPSTGAQDVVFVADAIDKPFADVCRLFAEASFLVPGSVVAVSNSMATIDVSRGSAEGDTAELRILPIRGGSEAITELVLISKGDPTSTEHHSEHVTRARTQLSDIVHTVEASASGGEDADLGRLDRDPDGRAGDESELGERSGRDLGDDRHRAADLDPNAIDLLVDGEDGARPDVAR